MTWRKIVATTATAVALLCWAPAAWGAARFASPAGTGTACTQPEPCDIVTAVNKSAASDDVTIEPGTYGPIASLLTDEGHTLTIHGQAGAPRPVIITPTDGFFLRGFDSSLTDVEVDDSGIAGIGLLVAANGVSVERVLIHTLGERADTCIGESVFTMIDSICVADGVGSTAFSFAAAFPVTATLRNDTLEAPGGSGEHGGVGLLAASFTGHAAQMTLINTIAHGSQFDLVAHAKEASSAATIVAEHSNYATQNEAPEAGGTTSITKPGTATNQAAPPLFANVATDDFHELAGSPTIGAGLGSPANGLTDLDGVPRQFAGATDIGAYQFVGPPTCHAASAATAFGTAVGLQLGCGDPLAAPLSYAIVSGPAHGTASLNGATGAVTYTPAPGYSGPDGFTFDATSSHGTSAPATATITVAAAPAPAGGGVRPASLAPSDSQPVLTPKTFAALARGASVAKARGTTVTYTDTEAATTTFTVRRQIGAGVLAHGRCVARPHGASSHGKRCTRFSTLGTFSHADVAGPNRFRFTGRVRGSALKPGSYQLLSAPSNAAGTGATHTNSFTIVRG
jgi:hypothetical protein